MKFLKKTLGVAALANLLIFVVFFFDLDGRFFFYIYEPFMKKHYDNMKRVDVLQKEYDISKFPKYDYE